MPCCLAPCSPAGPATSSGTCVWRAPAQLPSPCLRPSARPPTSRPSTRRPRRGAPGIVALETSLCNPSLLLTVSGEAALHASDGAQQHLPWHHTRSGEGRAVRQPTNAAITLQPANHIARWSCNLDAHDAQHCLYHCTPHMCKQHQCEGSSLKAACGLQLHICSRRPKLLMLLSRVMSAAACVLHVRWVANVCTESWSECTLL